MRALRRSADYSGTAGGGELAAWLAGVRSDTRHAAGPLGFPTIYAGCCSPDYREFTYGLLGQDMTVEDMRRLGPGDLRDMLGQAGVENILHQSRIIGTSQR